MQENLVLVKPSFCLLGANLVHSFFFFFLEVSDLLDVRHCTKLQSCAISRKINDGNLRKRQET